MRALRAPVYSVTLPLLLFCLPIALLVPLILLSVYHLPV